MSPIRIPKHVMARRIGEDCVMLDLEQGVYYGLNAVGARIWELLSDGASEEAICSALEVEFHVTAAQAREDLADLLDDLQRNRLIDR